ncbi:DUF6220 domain-containing protein [Microlunatus sp. GCM10028923]|uniref:DUF6220 domain-containing protein n=1 Tax=Microlunatus sp. GCM10028923 TaxID=3273400 RepID=UPI0036061F0A
MRRAFLVLSIMVIGGLVLQFYLAGVGVFSMPEDELFHLHGNNGRIVLPVLIILWIVSGFLARAGRRTIGLTFLALGLLAFQTVLFILTGVITGAAPPPDGQINTAGTIMLAFHALNGLSILFIGTVVARRAWRLSRQPAPAAEAEVLAPIP